MERIPVTGRRNLLFQFPDFGHIRRVVLCGIRNQALLKGLALVAEIGGCAVNVQRVLAGCIHIGDIVFEFLGHSRVGGTPELAYADGVHVSGLAETAEAGAEKDFRILNRQPCTLIDDAEVGRAFSEVPLDAVQVTALFETEAAAVGAVTEPGLIERVGISLGGTAARPLESVEHGAEKEVKGRFAGFISAVEDIQAVAEDKAPVLQRTESAYVEFTDNHVFCPLSSVVCSKALTP